MFLDADNLIAIGILALLGFAIIQLRETGQGSDKSKALLWKCLEFCLVSILFGFAQEAVDLFNLTFSTYFGIEPNGNTLTALGALTLLLGVFSGFWAIGLSWYPSRGYSWKVRFLDAFRDLFLIGMIGLDVIFCYSIIQVFVAGTYASNPIIKLFYPFDVACAVLGVPPLPYLFFNRAKSKRAKILLWVAVLLPLANNIVVKLYQVV